MSAPDRTMLSDSPETTRAVGRRIGAALRPGDCIALIGSLGAGKTELVKGIAAGAEVPPGVTVSSPTFVIVNEYPGRVYLYHVDAYRLGGAEELAAIGFTEMLDSDGVVIVEWADRVNTIMPSDCVTIRMDHAGENARRLTVALPASAPVHIADAAIPPA